MWKEYFTRAILSLSSLRFAIIARLNVIYTKFRCAMIAQLNKMWRVWAVRVRLHATHGQACFMNIVELFSPWKSKLTNFCFSLIFICNKREPENCTFFTNWWKSLFEFVTSQTCGMIFLFFNIIQ